MSIEILDSEELFFLGIRASENNDHEKALIYFKKSIELDKSARSVYLLGAEYAEIGMFERAYVTMQEAVLLEPELWDAHFQSGLVKFVVGDVKTAETAWKPLDQLHEDSALVLFKRGILAFSSGNKLDGEKLINQGISSNVTNPAMNQVMSSLLAKLLEMEFQSSFARDAIDQVETVEEDDKHEKMNRLFMQAYKSKTRQ